MNRFAHRGINLPHENWFVQRVKVFLFFFVYPGLFMINSAGISTKAEDDYPTGAPGPCSQFLVGFELLICFFYFVCIIFVTLCSLLCESVFHVWSGLYCFDFQDYIVLISASLFFLQYKKKKQLKLLLHFYRTFVRIYLPFKKIPSIYLLWKNFPAIYLLLKRDFLQFLFVLFYHTKIY